jgi:hypothetical protein
MRLSKSSVKVVRHTVGLWKAVEILRLDNPGLKPRFIFRGLIRGAEAPLFHGAPCGVEKSRNKKQHQDQRRRTGVSVLHWLVALCATDSLGRLSLHKESAHKESTDQFVLGAAEEGLHGADYQADHEHDDYDEDCG